MACRCRREGRRGTRRRARHADHLVRPRLSGDPLQGIKAIGGIIGVDAILAFRPVPAASVLVNRDIAVRDDVMPAAQDRTAEGFLGARQPGSGAIGLVDRIGRGDPVGRAMQDDGPSRPAALRQKHEGVEPGAIAHRYHGLRSASVAGSIGEPHGRCSVKKRAGDRTSSLTVAALLLLSAEAS